MAEIVACPRCQRRLHVPTENIGQQVQCPECRHTFTASSTAVSTPAPASSAPNPPPAADERRRRDDDHDDYGRRRRSSYDDDEYDDMTDVRRRGYGRDHYEPHRGGTILAIGLIALIGGFMTGFFFILGPIAWIMGSSDLTAIRDGRMDPSGEQTTRSGQICGIISTLCLILGALLMCVMIMRDIR